MPRYLQQITYTLEAWHALIKDPQNRIDAVRPAVEKLGGKIETAYFAFGDHDVILIAELPDNISAAALAMAFAAGGACRNVKTTPLLSPAEAVEAMKKASQSGYKPVKA